MRDALTTYGFLSAKLKSRISKTMPPEAIDRLVKSRSLPEAVQFLKGTVYAPIEESFSKTGDLRAGEALINARELELYTGLFRFLKEPELGFICALSLRFEVEKVKDAARLWFESRVRGRAIDGRSGYIYRQTIANAFDVDAVINAADADALVAALEGTPYAAIAREHIQTVVSGRSIFPFEMALDRFYYDRIFAAASRLRARDRDIAERVLGIDVDMQNVSWLVRFKGFYHLPADKALGYLIPRGRAIDAASVAQMYGGDDRAGSAAAGSLGFELLAKKYGGFGALLGKGGDASARLQLMESALRQITLAEAGRSLAGYPFSIGVVLAYFAREREELRTIMTILNAKNYSLSEERIRNAL